MLDITIPITFILNGIAITFSLVMLLLVLWNDSRTAANWFFALFVGMGMLWSVGTILFGLRALITDAGFLSDAGIRLSQLGFTASCVCLYLYVTFRADTVSRAFIIAAAVICTALILFQVVITFSADAFIRPIPIERVAIYNFNSFSVVLYTSFIGAALISAWSARGRFGTTLLIGIIVFSIGALSELYSPQLRLRAIGVNLSVIGVLLVCIATIRAQIIQPLTGRALQLQAVRDVGVAITGGVNIQNVQDVLGTIARQAAEILGADGAAIFLRDERGMELAAVYNMPSTFMHRRLQLGEGLVGKAVAQRQTMRLENYRRDWSGVEDMPFARVSFGSVLAAPLIFADEVVGSLFIVSGVSGKRFDREDARLVDLVSPQAAVAVINSRLFARQLALTRELEGAKNQMETLLFSAQNPILALNRRLEIIFANPAAISLLDTQIFTGRSIMALPSMQQALPLNPLHAARELLGKRVYTYEATIRDRTYLCHIGLLARDDPQGQGYVAVLNDITDLKALDAIKNQMIRMTSHDLKNPLMAALLHVEELTEEVQNGSLESEGIVGGLNVIQQQLERMERIIRSILDLERLQSGMNAREPVDLNEILTQVVSELTASAERANVTITTHIPPDLPAVPGDKHYLARAFANLIENAIKFTPPNGQISIGGERDSGFAIIHIADNGLGIPHEAQNRLFERFYRANQPGAEQITGTGLGLSLVKSVVVAHKGRIWLESEPGQGTTFHLALPLK